MEFANDSGRVESRHAPDDQFLIASFLGGDTAALRTLMDRYDRLVRFAVFRTAESRCLRDPHWLESVASDTWLGFVQSLRRDSDNLPRSLAAYLTRIARNRCISELRKNRGEAHTRSLDDEGEPLPDPGSSSDPSILLARVEDLTALRACLEELEASDRAMISQLSDITERRWRRAAEALGMSESTLRSRWQKTLDRLRRCVEKKAENSLAPREVASDSSDVGGLPRQHQGDRTRRASL